MAFYEANGEGGCFSISFTTNPRYDFGVFAKGYGHAASSLAKGLLSRTRFPDHDAYPVAFLYRHALELHLKNIIYQAARLSAFKGLDNIDSRLHNQHALSDLCQSATRLARILFAEDEAIEQLLGHLAHVCREWSDIDPESFSYRYPINKDGARSTKPNQIVSLRAMHRTIDGLLESLEILDFGLDVETERAQEMYEVLQEVAGILQDPSESL